MKECRKLSLQNRCLIKIGIDNRGSPGKIAKNGKKYIGHIFITQTQEKKIDFASRKN
jgi:hypothetical protein